MSNDNVGSLAAPAAVSDPLTDLLRAGARELIEAAVSAEFGEYLSTGSNATRTSTPRPPRAWRAIARNCWPSTTSPRCPLDAPRAQRAAGRNQLALPRTRGSTAAGPPCGAPLHLRALDSKLRPTYNFAPCGSFTRAHRPRPSHLQLPAHRHSGRRTACGRTRRAGRTRLPGEPPAGSSASAPIPGERTRCKPGADAGPDARRDPGPSWNRTCRRGSGPSTRSASPTTGANCVRNTTGA